MSKFLMFAVLALAFVAGAQATGAVTSVTAVASSYVSGTPTDFIFAFTPATTVPIGGSVTVIFPSGYFTGTPSATAATPFTLTGGAITATSITFTTGGAVSGVAAITVTVTGMTLGSARALTTGGFTVSTNLDTAGAADAPAISGKATLNSVIVRSTQADSTAAIIVIVFTPTASIQAGGTIVLTGPVDIIGVHYLATTAPLVVTNVPSLTATASIANPSVVTITTAGAPTTTSAIYVTLFGVTMGSARAAGVFTLTTSIDTISTDSVTAPALVAVVPVAISASLETSTDLPAVGGRLTDGRDMAFAVAADRVPNTVNTGAVTVGFTMVNAVQVGGSVVLTLPAGYFTAVDATKSNTFTTTGATASCTLSKLTTTTTDTVTCTVAGAALAAGAQTLTFIAGAVTTGGPTAAATYNVATSSDQQLTSAPGVLSLGGALTAGSALAYTTAANNVPGTLNTDTVTVGFTPATAVPVGGTVTLTTPLSFFTAVDSSKVGTFTTSKATCTCALTKATTATTDTVICTVAGAAVAAVAQTLTLVAGTVTVGGPMASTSTGFSMQTSTDLKVAFPAFAAHGGVMTGGSVMTVGVNADRVPLTTNTGLFTFPGTTATALPSGSSITLTLPKGYFASINVANTISFATNSGLQSTCALNKGSATATTDTITCTTTAAVAAGASGGLVFGIGSVRTGGPQIAGTYLLATKNDLSFTAPATLSLGGAISSTTPLAQAITDQPALIVNTATWTFGFTATTAISVGGTITLSLPNGFFSAVDSTKTANTVTGNAASFLTCSLTKGATPVDRDSVVCTVTGAAISTLITGVELIAGTVTNGLPLSATGNTYTVTTSVDLAGAATAIVQIGGVLTAQGNLFFTTAADQIPGTLNTGTVTFGFTTAAAGAFFGKAIAVGGKITLLVHRGYFVSVDSTKVATVTGTGITGCTALCVLSKAAGVDLNDKVICTTIGVVIPISTAVVVTLIAGTVTTGVPVPPATYQVSTSQDNVATTSGNSAGLGGFLTAGVDMTFTNALDQTSGKFSSNNATIQLGFTTTTAIPTKGAITLTMPPNYFSKVDATKSVTVGTNGATATCTLTQSSLISNVPTTISPADKTAGTTTTLTISFVPSLITGFNQVNVPLAGFAFDSTAVAVATCTANCASSAATASIASGVLTLTLPFTNSLLSVNTVTTFTVTNVKNPTTAGWATNNIASTLFKPYATVTCTTATAIVTAGANTLTFPALSVTIGTAQNAGTISIETSVDIALQIPVAAPAIALAATGAVKLAFSNPADGVPGRTNVGKITLGFTSANSLAIGSLVIMKFPKFYFTRVDPKAANTLTDSAAPSKAIAHINSVVGTRITSSLSCVLTPAVAPATQDTLTCTTGGSASGTGAQTVTLVPGAVTTGLSAGGGFTIATAPPPAVVTRIPYFPKAAGSTAGIAWVMAAVAVALAWL